MHPEGYSLSLHYTTKNYSFTKNHGKKPQISKLRFPKYISAEQIKLLSFKLCYEINKTKQQNNNKKTQRNIKQHALQHKWNYFNVQSNFWSNQKLRWVYVQLPALVFVATYICSSQQQATSCQDNKYLNRINRLSTRNFSHLTISITQANGHAGKSS